MTQPCVLFDLDGTLTDADHLHHAAFNAVLAPFGRQIDVDYYKAQVMGHANSVIFDRLLPGESTRHKQIADAKEAHFRRLAKQMTPLAGLQPLLAKLRDYNIPHGVVTNAPRANALHELAAMGLSAAFDALVIGEELPHAKPHPLPYLTGLSRLGAGAENSIAFEDSPSGLAAALDAGLMVVGIATSLAPAALLQAGATLAIADYNDARLWELMQMRLGI